jgi:DNA-binding HxlR family transcriptional regulator
MPLDTPHVAGRPCSVAAALELVGDRWSLLIVREVLFGNHRFSEIARNTGAPRDRLAARLKALVAAGILEQREYQTTPPRSGYHLSQAGQQLRPVIDSLRQWGDSWAVSTPPLTIRHHEHVLRSTTMCTECGERVLSHDLERVVNSPGWSLAGPIVPEPAP